MAEKLSNPKQSMKESMKELGHGLLLWLESNGGYKLRINNIKWTM